MAKSIMLVILLSLWSYTEDKTANLKLDKQTYDSITATMAQSELIIDSVIIGLKYLPNTDKIIEDLKKAKNYDKSVRLYLMNSCDSVFYPQKR